MRNHRSTKEVLLLMLLHIALVPLVAPFVSGANQPPHPPAIIDSTLESTTLLRSAVTSADNDKNKKKGARFSRLFRSSPEYRSGENGASWISRAIYSYATPLISKAKNIRLTKQDAYEMDDSQKMVQSVSRLSRIHDTMKLRHPLAPSRQLTRALLQFQKSKLIQTGALRLANTIAQAFPAVLVARLLRLVEAGADQPVEKALGTAVQLIVVLSIKMIIENQYFHQVVQCSTQVRGGLAGLIFNKSLQLPSGGSVASKEGGGDSLGAGGVLNLMQSDTGTLEGVAMQLHTIWDGPLQIAIYTSLLFRYLGPSVLYGIAALLITIPINSIALRILNRFVILQNQAKDARTRKTAEAISHMKLLKLQGWEEQFAADVRQSRQEELQRHVDRGLVRALSGAISNAVPAIVLVVTLTAYAKSGRPIVASTIFTAISLFNQLRFPLFFYPLLIDSVTNGNNAIKRVAKFLAEEEVVPYVNYLPATNGEGAVEMTNGNFLWSSSNSSATPALADVNLKVNPGEVVAVVGSVGSGKSALISAFLGELMPAPGAIVHSAVSSEGKPVASAFERPSVVVQGDIAYCSQEAWLPKGTIRDAITFGREYDEERYMEAIYDACLDEDMVDSGSATTKQGVLSHETDVGEGGSSLSGGQRARVALARALYGRGQSTVFLLDDCLAALDASVGSAVFERLTKRLRKSKAATLLVTNDPSLPRRCDRVVLMDNVPGSSSCSTVLDDGTYDELLERGHRLKSMTAKHSDVLTSQLNDTVHETRVESVGQPKDLLSLGTRRSIRVVGGYRQTPENGTACCHADCEETLTMQNCPDSIADHVDSKASTNADLGDDESASIFGGSLKSNETPATFYSVDESVQVSSSDHEKTGSDHSITEKSPTNKIVSADDSMAIGAVPWATYVSYLKSVGSPVLVLLMVACYLMSNGAQFFQQYTVAKWTEVGVSALEKDVGAKYLRSLVNAAGVTSVFLWIRSFLTMKVGVRASGFWHTRMLKSVFAAPMSFFDATPSGQLLSRFGKEIETVDSGVPDSIGSVLFCFLQIFFSMGALISIVTPGMGVPLAVVGVLYTRMMLRFRPAARDLKRAETKTRSPIYTHFGEAIRGSEIIRSIRGARATWSVRHQELSDTNLSVFYTVKSLDRWLSTRLETLGNTVVFTAAIASVFLTRVGKLKAGSAGWGLTQSLAITGLLTWAVRCLTDLESNMMSVMRVKELTDLDGTVVDLKAVKNRSTMAKELAGPGEALVPLLPTQSDVNASLAPLDTGALMQSGWPWRGSVQFRNVSMRYNVASPLVLRDVSISVPAGTTLGVVGRTGSGKSSLLLTLFRLSEIEAGGAIEIDGVDIRSISMQDLRQSLAIIPQDPVLFTGTIAYNLDATGKASEEDMLAALEAASPSVAAFFRSADGFKTQISERGKNLSLGQRQLICLARALLRKSRILVLDEATSSVDSKTDEEVQETIRREFVRKGVTVITVAHRLDTVLGYDNIAVLREGKLMEYGPPAELMNIPGGELQRLVQADRLNKRKGGEARKELTVSLVPT